MKISTFIPLLNLFFLAPLTASCTGSFFEVKISEEGQVLQTEDIPCFSIAKNEETEKKLPKMRDISVYELLDTGSEKKIWGLYFGGLNNPPTMLSPNSCIPYGTTPANSTTSLLPSSLEAGKRYEMYILSDMVNDPISKRRVYRANFCIAKEESTQKITVYQVHYDENLGKVRWDICGITN